MKKTITINLAGIVFHIEEDGYEVLQKYLHSVKAYFQKVEGGEDILVDIESRIAELFSGLLLNRQAISIEDVEGVIRQLGTVEDMMGDEDLGAESSAYEAETQHSSSTYTSKRLLRDTTNAIIGGVCSGVAAYFEVNPLWIRLITLAFFLGLAFLPPISGFVFLTYIVLWIAMPGQKNLENKGGFRKYFRSRKDKILGGVAGGIGRYFNIDPVIVRVLFILFIAAGGSGVVLYIVLWAITPEAKSVTDELQMEGNPVTLSNIEDQIKKNVKLENKETENLLIRILVFPFKLIGTVITSLGPLVKALGHALRISAGIFLLFLGGVLLFAFTVLFLAATNQIVASDFGVQLGNFPLHQLSDELSPALIAFGSLGAGMLVLLLLTVSFSLLINRNLLKPLVLGTVLTLFLVGAIGFGVFLIPLVQRFSNDGHHYEQREFRTGFQTMHIRMRYEDEKQMDLHPVKLTIKGWDAPNALLKFNYEAHGRSWKEAAEQARTATYDVDFEDSTLTFGANLELKEGAKFRFQNLGMTLYLPYNQKFTMDPSLQEILLNTLHPQGYSTSDLENNTWIYTRDGLHCITCPEKVRDADNNWDDADAPDAVQEADPIDEPNAPEPASPPDHVRD